MNRPIHGGQHADLASRDHLWNGRPEPSICGEVFGTAQEGSELGITLYVHDYDITQQWRTRSRYLVSLTRILVPGFVYLKQN